jgi:hypothetical protein
MSNEPGSGRRPALSELIASWRKVASIVVKHQRDGAADVEAIAYRTCANELEAALPASSEGAHGQCVCTVDDGLVQEWISKARAVARAKGFETTPAEGAHGLKCDKCGTAMTHTQSLILLWPNGPWLCPTCASVLVDDLEGDLAEGAHGWQDYVQHKDECASYRCAECGDDSVFAHTHILSHNFKTAACTCGLDALLTPSTPEDQ